MRASTALRDRPGSVEDAGELLLLVASRPAEALERAQALLAYRLDADAAARAWQAHGIARRELGDPSGALADVRKGLRIAQQAGLQSIAADLQATLGATLAVAGYSAQALDAFDAALSATRGTEAARVRLRRAGILRILGRYEEALQDLRHVLPVLERAGDLLWMSRAHGIRGLIYLDLGTRDQADLDLGRMEELLQQAGQDYEAATARHNRGLLALRAVNLPTALRHLEEASRQYAAVGASVPELEFDQSEAMLAAGMPAEAVRHADKAFDLLRHAHRGTQRPQALLAAGTAALAAGNAAKAQERASAALRLFHRQGRERWEARARLVALRASWAADARGARLATEAAALAQQLEVLHEQGATEARVLAGRFALAAGRKKAGEVHLSAAAKCRRSGTALQRVSGWLAQALLADARGDRRGVYAACRRGLAVLDEHRLSLGAAELRAAATAHGAELAALALRHALRSGSPERLFCWSERWRATALSLPPLRPPEDPALAADLRALRDASRAPDRADEQARLERAVRYRVLGQRGDDTRLTAPCFPEARALRRALGPRLLVEVVDVDGDLHVVTVGPRGLHRHASGRAHEALAEVEHARAALRRLSYGGSAARMAALRDTLLAGAERLERLLLGDALNDLDDGHEVVAVLPGRLHAVPWSLLPRFRDRVVTVAPSAAAWLRADGTCATPGRVALVVGPGLQSGGAEVPQVAALHLGATVLGPPSGQPATVDATLHALDGAALAHIAAHGTFRADNPLFSSLHLEDGPLTVHDLQGLQCAPRYVVLSSCDSGAAAVVGADELLGLSSALLALGTAGLLASTVPVNDAATVPLMVEVHRRLRAGATLRQALPDARRALPADDPVAAATAAAFVVFGAG